MKKARNGFTLIELLVVVSIIAILMSLAFPAYQSAMDAMRRANASVMCTQLATAVNQYNTEYGTWPLKTAGVDNEYKTFSDWNDLDICLNGNRKVSDGSPVANPVIPNPRSCQFMSLNRKDLVNYPNPSNEAIWSPVIKAAKITSSGGRLYHLIVDGDYDGVITVPDVSKNSGTFNLTQGVAVWCYGDDQGTDNRKLQASYK